MSEEKFEAVAQTASEDAAAVKCSKEEYQDGLRGIIQRMEDDLAASKEF